MLLFPDDDAVLSLAAWLLTPVDGEGLEAPDVPDVPMPELDMDMGWEISNLSMFFVIFPSS